jgi:hypothetical protein
VKFPTWLGHVIKSGKVTLFTGDKEALQLKTGNKKIDLNAVDKEFLKEAIGGMGGGKSILNSLSQLKTIATELKNEGLTIALSYKGELVLTVGSEANPKFSRIVTGTDAIEINNLRKLIELGV